MKAFSIGYEGNPPEDERNKAQQLARKFDVDFIQKEIKTKDVVNHFPKLVYDADDPIADIAGYSIYSLAKLAKENNVKVLLGGLGGDELFWGYPSTIKATKENVLKFSKLSRKTKKILFKYYNPDPKITGSFITKLYADTFTANLSADNIYKFLIVDSVLNSLDIAKLSMDLVRDLWLKSDPICLNDRLSMAASVELRSPFLDYRLVETVLSSKKAVQAFKLEQKYYLKKAMSGLVPNEVMRRTKRGFTPPVNDWLTAIIDNYKHLLNDGFLLQNKIIDDKKLKKVMRNNELIPKYSLYQLIHLEIWGREYLWGVTSGEIK